MHKLLTFIFIVFLPALIFLGHDLYIFYENQGMPANANVVTKLATEKRPAKAFDFSSFGFMLNRYSPEMKQTLQDGMMPEERKSFELFLTYKGFYVSVAFALALSLIGIAVYLLKILEVKARSMKHKARARRH